jgi:hypothetical protein
MRKFPCGIFAVLAVAQFLLLVVTGQSFARPRLAWDQSPGEIDGYMIHCWSISDGLEHAVDAGFANEYPMDDLPLSKGQVNCFSITAYNSHGESGFSNPVCWAEDSSIVQIPAWGAFGNPDGSNSLGDQEVNFSFEGLGRDMLIRYTAYDVDLSDEVKISINGRFTGYVPRTENECWGEGQVLTVPAKYLNLDDNILTFTNTRTNWQWAVSNVEVE